MQRGRCTREASAEPLAAHNATLGCVIRAGKATGANATVTLKTSGRTVRLNATTKIRVRSVRYRTTTVRGTARR